MDPTSRRGASCFSSFYELNVDNAHRANTIILLRERTRDLRALYARMWRCLKRNPVRPILFGTGEGERSWESRARNLNRYISDYVTATERVRHELNRDDAAKNRWEKASRSGGERTTEMRMLSRAVNIELMRRQSNGTLEYWPVEVNVAPRRTIGVDHSSQIAATHRI